MSKYTKEIFVEKLKEYGYIYISGEYVNCKSILKCYDIEGYIVYISFDRLENHKSSKPQRFHKNNPNTEYNIMIYLQRHHECLCKYHSGKYVDAKSILDFECKCGNIFSTTFDNVRHFHKNKCDTCSGYNLNLSFNDVKNNLSRKGYFLTISEKDYKGITLSPLTCTDKDGYKYNVAYDSVMRDRKMETFSSSNPFVIDNINLYLQKHTKGEYKCISNKYIGAREPLEILHVKCNRIFQQSWMNISRKRYLDKLGDNKTGSQCPFCDATQLESTHALVLKQVWIHEKDDTIVEDKSCINPNTNCPLPTDIVNHRLKIAIEIQSWFHDFEEQKIKDKIKKEYWINRGYEFYDIDQRDYTVLEMIQIFFPSYNEIPNYIDFEYSNKINDVKIQELLNKGLKIVEIANIIGCKPHQIYDAIHYGRITYPIDYMRADYTSVVQLDNNLKYVNEFDSIVDAKKNTGCKNISCALKSKTHYSGGYYWIQKDDYYNNSYSIQKSRLSKFNIPVEQYDINENFIESYDTIFDASRKYNCTNYEILEVMDGKRKTRCGYIWRYKNK